MTTNNLAASIDALGDLRRQIQDLQAQEDELRTSLIESGYDLAAGDRYVLQVSTSDRTTVDWKAVVAKLEPSHQLLSAHTKVSSVTTVKVTDKRTINATKLNRKLKLAA